jgi:hypothetical protein
MPVLPGMTMGMVVPSAGSMSDIDLAGSKHEVSSRPLPPPGPAQSFLVQKLPGIISAFGASYFDVN